jgi:hypothetical protein
MRVHGGGPQRVEEKLVVGRAGGVIAAQRRRDVRRDRLGSDATRLASRRLASNSIGNEHHRCQPLSAQGQALDGGEARAVDVDLRIHRADEEVILILGADLSRMRDAEEVKRAVRRPHAMFVRRPRRLDRLHGRGGARRPRG